MDCTHIFARIDANNHAHFCLFDTDGNKLYEGYCKLKLPAHVRGLRLRKLDDRAHEQIVRQITRECMDFDVGMGTPIYAI